MTGIPLLRLRIFKGPELEFSEGWGLNWKQHLCAWRNIEIFFIEQDSVSSAFQRSIGYTDNFPLFTGLYKHINLLNEDTIVAWLIDETSNKYFCFLH